MVTLPPGQAGIAFRSAWLAGDVFEMRRLLPQLDAAHHVELVLGAALRDGRDGFAAARMLAAGTPPEAVLPRLIGTPDTSADEAATAWITARVVPNVWRPDGDAATPADVTSVDACARAYGRGVGGMALLARLDNRPLHAAVHRYYTTSRLHVLGPRPLLVLAGT